MKTEVKGKDCSLLTLPLLTNKKRFFILAPVVSVIKPFSSSVTKRPNKIVFVLGKPFKTSLLFASKEGPTLV